MTHDPYTITPTSPARELANIEHRRRILERALADEPRGSRAQMNRSELQHLDEQHAAWSEEREANRRAWIRHHERQWRNHVALARRHYVAWIQLLNEEVMPAELDQPSTNGSR